MLVNQIHKRTKAGGNGRPQAETSGGSGGKNILNVAEMINIIMKRYIKGPAAFTFYLIKSLQVFDVINCHNPLLH